MGRSVPLTIERLSQLGEGVALLEGRTVFVRGALPGERVLASVEEQGSVLRGTVEQFVGQSAHRRTPSCELAGRCGGCDWLHFDEGAQRDAKTEIVLSTLEHLGGILRSELEIQPLLSAGEPMGYRRRAVLHPHRGALGFFEHKSHERVTLERCPAMAPELSALPGAVREPLAPVLADAEEIQLLTVEGRRALAATLKGAVKASHQKAAELTVRQKWVDGIVLTPKEGSAALFGHPVLRATAPLRPEVPLYLRPDGFAQANAAANELLVKASVELLPTPAGRLLELYSGNGNFTFALAARAEEVLAVESGAVSVELARRSAREAKVSNVRFIQGDTKKAVDGLVAEKRQFDTLFLDPPRTGAKGSEAWAQRLHVANVIYVACDPAALARDARALKAAGFQPRALRIVDMFPQTRHVEAVLGFTRA